MATKIPMRGMMRFFNFLRKTLSMKIEKKTTAKDIQSFISSHKIDIARAIAKDKRNRGFMAAWKNESFSSKFVEKVNFGRIKSYEKNGKVIVQSSVKWDRPDETSFLKERVGMKGKDIVKSYFARFGQEERTSDSILKKVSALRKAGRKK